MFCIGTEEYGIGTIEKIYADHAEEMLFVCFEKGALYDWLTTNQKRVLVADGPAHFSLHSIKNIFQLPKLFRTARRAAEQLSKQLQQQDIRLVHTHWLPQQMVAGYLKQHHGMASVWQINNNSLRANRIPLVRRLNDRLANWGADLLLPASNYISENWTGCRVPRRTIHNTAPPIFDGPPQRDSATLRCLSAGRLVHSKGHHVVLAAVIELRQQGLDVTLDVFGGPIEASEYADTLRTAIESSQMQQHIQLHGYVAGMRQRHQEFDVAVQARLDPEPCSLWVCECLTDGLVTLGTDTGGTPELIEDEQSGYIYRAGDTTDLASKLQQVAENPELRNTMRKKAFQRGNGPLSLDRFISDTLDSYRSAISTS